MGKINEKQNAFALFQNGHSYGEIAKQLNIPKTTIYRWINSYMEQDETPEMPAGTGNGTDITEYETNYGTSETKNRINNPVSPEELAKIEIRKVELEHEFRIAELEFRKQQYLDQLKMKQNSEETENLQDKMSEIVSELDNLRKRNQDLQQKLEEKPKSETEDNYEPVFPKKIILSNKKIIKEFLSWDEKDCNEETLEDLYSKAQSVRHDIYDWGHKNGIPFSEIEEINFQNILIGKIWDVLSTYEEKDEVRTVFFDDETKVMLKDWLKANKNP